MTLETAGRFIIQITGPFPSVFTRHQIAGQRRVKTKGNSRKTAAKKSDFYPGYPYVLLDYIGHEVVIRHLCIERWGPVRPPTRVAK